MSVYADMCCRELGQNGEKKMTREEFEQLAGAGVILLDGATGSNLTKAGCQKESVQNFGFWSILIFWQIYRRLTWRREARLSMRRPLGKQIEISGLWKRKRGGGAECTPGGYLEKSACRNRCADCGNFSTPGKMLQPKGDLSYEELLESYTEQVTAVANAGVDLLVAETMLSVDETCVFMDAALSVCDLPLCVL